eukprot:921573-Rhodomonas_salina.2
MLGTGKGYAATDSVCDVRYRRGLCAGTKLVCDVRMVRAFNEQLSVAIDKLAQGGREGGEEEVDGSEGSE